ncbi:Glycosyltransferase involved in cell wall bisynthesis [Lachnospiraceae bacterium]|nr:Glycosyltransferase involved in cell wall bisynthesis [Lachnospiraceae bacterium]
MKVVLFGTGILYRQYKDLVRKDDSIIGIIDNDINKIGTMLDGIKIESPSEIVNFEFDIVICMNADPVEMIDQLLSLGIARKKIKFIREYFGDVYAGVMDIHNNCKVKNKSKNILFFLPSVNTVGGNLVVLTAADCLSSAGYNVVFALPPQKQIQEKKLIYDELERRNFDYVIMYSMPYLSDEEIKYAQQFDYLIVNSINLIRCVYLLQKRVKMIWWMHDPISNYQRTKNEFEEVFSEKELLNVPTYAVSHIAQKNFQEYFPESDIGLLKFCVPDIAKELNYPKDDELVFAVIGYIDEIKGQDIFLKAFRSIPMEKRRNVKCYIVGRKVKDAYYNYVRKLTGDDEKIVFTGEISHEKMKEIYKEIDVVVCTSRQETMSAVLIEGAMNGKVMISSDITGMAPYITEKENGLIFESEDYEDLATKMEWMIDNRDKINTMGECARQLYEREFTPDVFTSNIKGILGRL